MIRRILKIAIIVVLVAIIGVLGFIVIKSGALTGGKSNQVKTEKVYVEPKETIYSLGEYTVNLDEAGYKRYINVKVSVGYNIKKMDETLKEYTTQISDAINGILRSKKLEDVNSADKTDTVKREILNKINAILQDGRITNVYFDKILIQ